MTSSTPRPPDGPQPPTESWLRAMLRVGRPELGAVDESHLSRIWHLVDDDLDAAEQAHGSRPSALGPSPSRDAGSPTESRPVPVPALTPAPAPAPGPSAGAGRRGWRTHVPLAAAAAVALVVGVGVGASLSNASNPSPTALAEGASSPTVEPTTATVPAMPSPSVDEPTSTTLATYELEPLGADTSVEVAAVAAVLVADAQGRALELDLDGLPVPDGFHEVWLLDPDTGALASLGPVRPDGRYVVPTGTDLDALSALDVSAEPLDGDPGHSGVSLLRGEVSWVG